METFLDNSVLLITGSSRGIGAATARLAKAYGAKVALHGKEESAELLKLGKELGSPCYPCDVADRAAVKRVVKKIMKDFGRIDALVNNAGIADRRPFLETTDEVWQNVFKVNVLGTVHFCQEVIPHMQRQKYGRIVNVSSKRGFPATCGKPAYGASKAAVILLTAALAKEFAPDIAVNCVAPGFTETDMSKTWSEKIWVDVRQTLLGRAGKPEEIAEMILFLASSKASFITGQTFLVDGGASVSLGR
jgi:3-oxoacyl-[acyl-carrier protein] reductase